MIPKVVASEIGIVQTFQVSYRISLCFSKGTVPIGGAAHFFTSSFLNIRVLTNF